MGYEYECSDMSHQQGKVFQRQHQRQVVLYLGVPL